MNNLEQHWCPNCGIEFWSATRFFECRRQDGVTFYCPNGHTIRYNGEFDKLRRERARLRRGTGETGGVGDMIRERIGSGGVSERRD